MNPDNIHLYLSKDIVQGEEVPFYIRWKDQEIEEFHFNINGFDAICEFDNIKDGFDNTSKVINIKDLKQNYFLGGSIKTSKTPIPYKNASFQVTCILQNGMRIELYESRTLYTTFLEIIKDQEIVNVKENKTLLNINLRGATTVFIDIENYPDSEIKLVLPKEIQSAFEKFLYSLIGGLRKLRVRYPNYEEVINIFLNLFENPDYFSEQNLLEESGNILKDFNPDQDFKEDFGLTFYNAVHIESNLLNLVIRPLIEYLESSTAKNAFLNSPLLSIMIPKGGGLFRGRIYYKNVIEREKFTLSERDEGSEFKVFVKSNEDFIIPIKEGIKIWRIEE